MLRTVAVQGYRSLRDLVLPLGQLSLITGANGSGKSSVHMSLRLLADTAQNAVVASLAGEGGLPATFWAGPETIARSVRQGMHEVEPLAKRNAASLKLKFGGDGYSYSIDLGYPVPRKTLFGSDPQIKRECIWHGSFYRKAAALLLPRPPHRMVLTSPRPACIRTCCRRWRGLILAAAEHMQIIAVSHGPQLIEVLTAAPIYARLHLVKEFGETTLDGATLFNRPKWIWSAR